MSWEVRLTGPDAVLKELSGALTAGDLIVAKSENEYVLRSSLFDIFPDAQSVRAEAERIVEALSGVSRVLLESPHALKVASVTEVRPDGRRNIFLQVEPGVIRISAGVASLRVT